jgi:hypothetical protein
MTRSADASPLATNRVSELTSVILVIFEATGELSDVQRCFSMSSLRVARLAATTSVQVDLDTTGTDIVAIVVNLLDVTLCLRNQESQYRPAVVGQLSHCALAPFFCMGLCFPRPTTLDESGDLRAPPSNSGFHR